MSAALQRSAATASPTGDGTNCGTAAAAALGFVCRMLALLMAYGSGGMSSTVFIGSKRRPGGGCEEVDGASAEGLKEKSLSQTKLPTRIG